MAVLVVVVMGFLVVSMAVLVVVAMGLRVGGLAQVNLKVGSDRSAPLDATCQSLVLTNTPCFRTKCPSE